jgi:ferredoxin
MKITVNQERCRGHNNCVSIAPHVFDLGDNFKAVVVDPKGDSDDDILKAAKMCPKLAIVLEDETSGARIFPGPDDKERDQLAVDKVGD